MLVVVSTERAKNTPYQVALPAALSGHVTLVSAIASSVTGMIHTPNINLANLLTLLLQFFETVFLVTFCDANCHEYIVWVYGIAAANVVAISHVTFNFVIRVIIVTVPIVAERPGLTKC